VSSLPWLVSAQDQLRASRRAGRTPHGLLIHEAPGTGGSLLATWFAQLILCTAETAPCGQCSGCRRVQSREHPDSIALNPDAESKLGQITVDQVRDLTAQLALSSYEGRGTVVLIEPAHALNRNAANALLKTLEEPRADAHLVLVTANPSLLPATVRSRCLRLSLPIPDREQVLSWLSAEQPQHRAQWPAVLEMLGVAPLDAARADVPRLLALRDELLQVLRDAAAGRIDVLRVAENWARDDLALRLTCIENCLTARVLAMRAGARLQDGGLDINIGPALRILDDVRRLQGQLATSLNKPLAVEDQLWRMNMRAGQ
jgi:DNA polymerase III subunit delta'